MANMENLIAGFTGQLREAMAIGEQAVIKPATKAITNVVVTGLGGSGIGGDLVNEFVSDELKVPFVVNKGYFVPNFVNENTLVICSSYSGNTEETLSAMEDAMAKGAQIACVTSGGKVAEIAAAKGYTCIIVPGGNPPRSMLAYSLVQQLYLLNGYGLISDGFKADLTVAIDLLDAEEHAIQTDALEIAKKLKGSVPVVYVDDSMTAVGVRFRQQINENSKMLSWSSPVPEMNHNELVGWRNKIAPWKVVFLRNNTDYARNQQRIEINKEIVGKFAQEVLEIWSKGDSHAERALYLIHLTDWVSQYLGELNGVDIVEVAVIDFLKGSLAKF